MAAKRNNNALKYEPFCKGAKVAVDKDAKVVHIMIPYDDETVEAAEWSSTGKSKAIASSAGHKDIDGTPIRLNLYAGLPARKLAAVDA